MKAIDAPVEFLERPESQDNAEKEMAKADLPPERK